MDALDAGPESVPAVAIGVDRNVFRRAGDFWTIAYEGKTLLLRDTKGMKYIAPACRERS